MHGYTIEYRIDGRTRETFIVAPNPNAAATALRAALGGITIAIMAMRPSHADMPRWIGAPLQSRQFVY